MQIQGSGQVQLADGSRVRLNYADQNGHPYLSLIHISLCLPIPPLRRSEIIFSGVSGVK